MASLNYNKVIISGKLCADPDSRQTQSGTPVTTIRVAVNRRFVKSSNDGGAPQQTADFFTVVAWQGTAEFVARYFRKGSSIMVEGRLQERQWTDQQNQKRYATEIVAEDVFFVDSKNENPASRDNGQYGESAPMSAPTYSAPATESSKFEDISNDDDLPF
jgi:single stranded DNA-binding protein (ssb)